MQTDRPTLISRSNSLFLFGAPWRSRQYVPPKRLRRSSRMHDAVTQQIRTRIIVSTKTSTPTAM